MCNSTINNTTFIFDESVDWFCICEGYFGPIALFLTSILCFIVGTPIHCWSLWVLLRGNFKSSLVFPLNITILELFFCIQCITDIIVLRFPSVVGDQLMNVFLGFNWTVRPLLQICTCIEKYLAVIHPVIFLRYKGMQYRIALVAGVWLISLGNSLRFLFNGVNYFKDNIFLFVFCIAVIITSFSCASVLHALKRPGPGDPKNVEMTGKDRNNKTDRGRAVENQQKRKAFRIISRILASILICYIPLVVIYFMNVAQISKHVYLCEVVPLTVSFTITAVLFPPLIRMYKEGHLKHVMGFLKKRQKEKKKI